MCAFQASAIFSRRKTAAQLLKEAFIYQDALTLRSFPIEGKIASYSGDGYAANLGINYRTAK